MSGLCTWIYILLITARNLVPLITLARHRKQLHFVCGGININCSASISLYTFNWKVKFHRKKLVQGLLEGFRSTFIKKKSLFFRPTGLWIHRRKNCTNNKGINGKNLICVISLINPNIIDPLRNFISQTLGQYLRR